MRLAMASASPRQPPAPERARALEVLDRLSRALPEARIALHYRSEVELLVSVILSAQCTDARVNLVTPALFARYPDAAAYARANPRDLWPFIRTCGLYRTKARSIVSAMRAIARGGGRVPRTREALEELPGVGRKTAGVVLIHLGEGNHFPVDTHVGRVARRLGFARELDPSRVERRLMALLPPERWNGGHQLLVWHGRRFCRARAPDCGRCPVAGLCPRRGLPRGRPATGPKRGAGPASPRRAPPRPSPP
jgi:endonuclease-3